MRTHFGTIAAATPFLPFQHEMIVGSLLGDGTLLRTTAGYCFRVHHGIAQRFLVDWKYGLLRNYVRTPPRTYENKCYFRTVTHPRLCELRAAFYEGSRKVVPLDLLRVDLTPLALAVWIMDDGAADGGQVRINTQSFGWAECRELASLMESKFNLTWTLNSDRGFPRLRCAAASMGRLRELIAPHLLPEMRYKLPA